MKGALTYLLGRRFKNQLVALAKNPSRLILMIALIAIIALTLFSNGGDTGGMAKRDPRELSAGVFALLAIVFILISKNGFDNGASMFRMQDVNLLFPSPVSPQKVLFYGLFQQLGTSLLIGLFLLFQYSWLHNLYGVGFEWIIVLFLVYGLTVFMAQLTAMAIYSFTQSNEKKKRIVKAVFYGICIVYAAGLLLALLSSRDAVLEKLLTTVNGTAFQFFPAAGFAAGIANGLASGSGLQMVVGGVLCAAYVAAIALLIAKGNPDYYEDVLESTETAHLAAAAKKQGRLGESAPRNVKTGKMGIGRGWGADAFYYKHLLENRRAKIFLFNTPMLIFIFVNIAFAFFMRESGLIPVFAFATYMQIFGLAFGRFSKELMKPFVYIIPEPPFKKMMACIRESFAGSILEAVIVFIPISLILGLTPVETLLCIAARFSFALLFMSANVLVGRLFGSLTSKALVMFVYIGAIIALCIPGLVIGVTLMPGFVGLENIVLLSAFTVCNIPVSLLVFYLCRDMLQYTELNEG